MATRTLKVPQEFIDAVNKFVGSMKKFTDLTKNLQAAQRRVQTPRRPHHHDAHQITSQFRNLFQASSRLERNLSRTVDMLGREFNISRFVSSSAIENIVSRIPTGLIEALPMEAGALRYAGAFLGPVGVIAGVVIGGVVKTFMKMASLSGAAKADYFKALGISTDVAGLRAFGLVYGPLGVTLGPMLKGIYDVQSTQYVALRVLRQSIVNADSADTMAQAVIKAAQLLQSMPEGEALPMAEGAGLTGLFDEATIIRLRTMSLRELTEFASRFARRRAGLKISPEIVKKFIAFNQTLQNASLTLSNKFIKMLTEGHPSILESLENISKAVTKLVVKFGEIVRVLNVDLGKRLLKGLQFVQDELNKLQRAVSGPAPGGPLMFRPGVGPRTRAAAAQGPLFRPHVGPRARAPAAPARGALGDVKMPRGQREDPRQLEQYIRDTATKYGIDPDTAVRVARSEGLGSFYGDNNTSFGAFQLHVTRGGGAVGDDFKRDTGLDPSDPRNERATIDYALRHARTHGWGAWMGARSIGVTGYRGIKRDAPIPPVTKYEAPQGPRPSVTPARAPAAPSGGPVSTLPNQAGRPSHIEGTVTVGGQEFGYASGGAGRGSIPYGDYPINIGDVGPIGRRIGAVASVGGPSGTIPDPKYPGDPRVGIEIHPGSGADLDHLYTQGCFGIPRAQWPAFKAALLNEAQKGPLTLSIQPNGRAAIMTREQFEAQKNASPVPGVTAPYTPVPPPPAPATAPGEIPPDDARYTARSHARVGEAPPLQSGLTVNQSIDSAARQSGLNNKLLYTIAGVESSYDPRQTTGVYKGLFQLSDQEFRLYGGRGDIYNASENARVAALKIKAEGEELSRKLGRPVTESELYLAHQRGVQGAYNHLSKPDAPAWQALYDTPEGRARGVDWAKKTVYRNVPAADLARYGGVEKMTNRQFVQYWHDKISKKIGSDADAPGAVGKLITDAKKPLFRPGVGPRARVPEHTTKYDKPSTWPEHGGKPIQYTGSVDDNNPKNKIKIQSNDSEYDVHVQESPATDLYNAPM